jgi:hypothetical protein
MPINTMYIQRHRKRRQRLARFDIRDLWVEFVNMSGGWTSRSEFLREVRALTTEPHLVEQAVVWCGDCAQADHVDRMTQPSAGSSLVCRNCITTYNECAGSCGGVYRYMIVVAGEGGAQNLMCDACRDERVNDGRVAYCSACGYWHLNTEEVAEEHWHGKCRCESPAGEEFFVRNDGKPRLANDTRVTVTLPAGEISDEGIGTIAQYLRDWSYGAHYLGDTESYNKVYALSVSLGELGNMWQTKQGNYTKRLSRLAYKKHGLKLPPEVLSHIGNLGRDHSMADEYLIETTRRLNLSAADFGHAGSCWWMSYTESRCTLKSNGGFGLRTFDPDGHVIGRVWVMPLKKVEPALYGPGLMPTFESESPDAFMVFNGYGNLSGYPAARIVAYMAGMTYRKVGFTASPMYINNESGYLVAPEEIAERFTDGEIHFELDVHSNLFNREAALAAQNERVLTNA